MKIGGCYWGKDSMEMLEAIPKLANHFSQVRLSSWIRGLKDPGVIAKLLEYKKRFGIGYNIHMAWCEIDIASLVENVRQASLKECREVIDMLSSLGGGVLTFHPAMPNFVSDPKERHLVNQCQLDSFRKICSYAKDKNVIIAVENITSGPGSAPCFPEDNNFKTHAFLLERIDYDNFGVTFDTGHFHQHSHTEKMDIRDIFSRFGSRIKYVHAHDNDGMEDSHLIAGKGTFDWQLFLDLLNEYAFSGVLELELRTIDEQIKSKEFLQGLRPSYFNP